VRRAARNRAVKSEVKTLVVKARRALSEKTGGDTDRAALSMDALRALDRAAAKGIVHRNNAGRRKSRLARQLAKVAVAPAPAAGKAKKADSTRAKPAASKKK